MSKNVNDFSRTILPLPDLAYYGDPKELVVQYNLGSNSWSYPKRWPIEDGQLSPNGMVSGDLNGDKRTDLILLGGFEKKPATAASSAKPPARLSNHDFSFAPTRNE